MLARSACPDSHWCFTPLSAVFALVLLVLAATTYTPASAGEPVIASAAKLAGDGSRTTLTLELSRTAKFRLKKLAKPYRLIVELTDVDFRLPDGSGTKGHGLVTGYRYGSFGPGKSQLVIELNKPVAVDRSVVEKASGDTPPRLVIELSLSTKEAFLGAASPSKAADKDGEPAVVVVPKQSKANPQKVKPVVLIDPGHGGVDLGARSVSGLIEKNVVLEFATEFAAALDATGRYKVVLTRTTDVFIPLKERVDLAQELRAGLFISLHADWVAAKYANKARGLAVYTRSEQASDEEARLLAMRENSSDEAGGISAPSDEETVVQDLLTDLWQEETRVHSRLFAQTLIGQVKKTARLLIQPHRFAAFYVLRNPEVPSVLVELGFLSNASDAKELATKAWRTKIAEKMVAAVDRFFADARQPLSALQ